MGKQNTDAIRLHSQEREWLLNLGNGNILKGVQNLIQQAQEETKRATSRGRRSKSSRKQ